MPRSLGVMSCLRQETARLRQRIAVRRVAGLPVQLAGSKRALRRRVWDTLSYSRVGELGKGGELFAALPSRTESRNDSPRSQKNRKGRVDAIPRP